MMTNEDALMLVAGGVLVLWWLWEHPEAAKVLGFVLLLGLVGFGVARASQTEAQRHRGYREGQRRHYRRRR